MAAMALRLGVRLRKPGVYALHAQAPSPGPADLARALHHAGVAAWSGVLLALAASTWLASGAWPASGTWFASGAWLADGLVALRAAR